MFLKQIRKINYLAKEELQNIKNKLQEKMEEVVSVFGDVLDVFTDKPIEIQLLNEVCEVLKLNGGITHLLDECNAIKAQKGNNHFPLLWQFYKSHRSAFFRLINQIQLKSTSTDQRLIKAVQFLKDNTHRRGKWLPNEIDLSWAEKQWEKLLLVQIGDKLKLSRHNFEVCLFSHLADELRSGDICVWLNRYFGELSK